MGFKIPIKELYDLKKKCNSKLFLDATASTGLENNHNLGDEYVLVLAKAYLA